VEETDRDDARLSASVVSWRALQGDNPGTSGSGQFLPQALSMTSFRPASCSVSTWLYRAGVWTRPCSSAISVPRMARSSALSARTRAPWGLWVMIAVGGIRQSGTRREDRPHDSPSPGWRRLVRQVGDGERVVYALGAAIEQPCYRRPQRRARNQPALAFIVAAVASRLQQQQGLIASNDTKQLLYSTIGSI